MQSLGGTWKLALDPQNVGRQQRWFDDIPVTAQNAPVPGIVQQIFPNQFGAAWYWAVFAPLRTAGPDERYLLDFEAVDYLAEVWVNGRAVGGHEGGETPFELDVTDAVNPGADNLLAVRVLTPGLEPIDGMTMERVPHRCKKCECIPGRIQNYGGIIAPVALKIVPTIRIADVFVRPDLRTGCIRAQITVSSVASAPARGSLEALVGPDKTGEALDARDIEIDVPPGDSVHELTLTVPQHRLWNLDDPFLYRMQARLRVHGQVEDSLRRDVHATHGQDARATRDAHATVRCGFRELRVEKGYFRLNGKRILLRSTHTGNHFPVTTAVPTDPDLMRRDFVMAKAAGYNTVRFICGLARPEQLDFCDEIGLMIYEESPASWEPMEDSPDMPRRFDLSVREMVLRDRNHPCVAIWGLLNETPDGPVFRHAVKTLSLLRSLDPTRLVLLNSSRWDGRLEIGSLCNPGGDRWEYQWGGESPEAAKTQAAMNPAIGAMVQQSGDVHMYPAVPLTDETIKWFRELGKSSRPVFLSEYGAGSIPNVIRSMRWYEQIGARADLAEVELFSDQVRRLEADWKRWDLEGVYPFPEDMMRHSELLHTRQRMIGFDMVRANPKICGFNITGMLDHGFVGEGVWTFWREWKPGTAEAFCDGWAPLRWCLFVNPLHGYSGGKFTLRAVLANEDVLPPGEYPIRLRVCGASGTVWEKRLRLQIPKPAPDEDGPLAVEAFEGRVTLNAPPGEYEFAASMDRGGAPFGGRLKFRVACVEGVSVAAAGILPASGEGVHTKGRSAIAVSLKKPLTGPLQTGLPVRVWGLGKEIEGWLKKQGVRVAPFEGKPVKRGEAILVGKCPDRNGWPALAEKIARGSCAVLLSLDALRGSPANASGMWIEAVGGYSTSVRDFAVGNAPKEEWPLYSREFYGPLHFRACNLPPGRYVVELGMCEGYFTKLGKRVFDVQINGKTVMAGVDLLKEAGGFQRALNRRFTVAAVGGAIDINTARSGDQASISFVRLRDLEGKLLLQYDVDSQLSDTLRWMPLKRKGRIRLTNDWLYHKECVAKAHPIFEGLGTKGIMDWDFYGPVISKKILEDAPPSDDVAAVAFHTGPYYSGIMLASYPFGAGRFIVNTFNVLENVGTHPAADRMLLNMIRYAQDLARPKPAPLPRDFHNTLKAIGYAV